MARKRSTIDQLPADIKAKLQELLRDPRVTQLEVTARINQALDAQGVPDKVSKSAVNRYAVKMDKVGARLRESREVAAAWIGKLGAAPQGQVGNLVNEILRTLSFDVSIMLQQGAMNKKTAPGAVKMIKELALTMMRLEKAANLNVEREKEIRKEALNDAVGAIDKAAAQQGLNAEQAAFWRQQVLGVQ